MHVLNNLKIALNILIGLTILNHTLNCITGTTQEN